MYLQVGSLTTTRDLVIGGSTVPAGSDLTSAQLAQIRGLSALLGKGWIYASPDPYRRRTVDGTPQPTHVNPWAYKTLVETLVAEETAPPPEGGGE